MKKLALDVGDRWTGIAISDLSAVLARPYKTVETKDLTATITTLLQTERIDTIVVGYPKTMRGTESAQTVKLLSMFDDLKKEFQTVTWTLWDERMTSKQASFIKPQKNKTDKLMQHSVAAALILGTYLDSLAHNRDQIDQN